MKEVKLRLIAIHPDIINSGILGDLRLLDDEGLREAKRTLQWVVTAACERTHKKLQEAKNQ